MRFLIIFLLDGYYGNQCEKRNICLQRPCQNGGTCFSSNNINFQCTCPTGFTGQICDTRFIDPYDKCASGPCRNGAACQMNSFGDIVCLCQTGYFGTRCEYFNKCIDQTCSMNGRCSLKISGQLIDYECSCRCK